jgi:catechol 2,3-dioxygenase-like lactoylglutathione lyase family enzyme
VLGRYLEIGIPTSDIQASIAFYEQLGFSQAPTGETWSHPYAVLTDGRLTLGLHGGGVTQPRLTFVQPELRRHVDALQASGVDVEHLRLATDEFNELTFTGAGGVPVHLVEARTYSPTPPNGISESACGYFSEWGWPVRSFEDIGAFWERLGFVSLDESNEPFTRLSVTSSTFNLAFYRSRALRRPVLTFEDADMTRRIADLRSRGFDFSDEMPDALDERENGVLVAPEGTRLLLMNSTD